MDIRHLNAFIALAEEGGFTAAARRLHVVQSGLSVTIRELEEELGVQLVQRTTRKVSLTAAGEMFLEYARTSVAALKDGVRAVRAEDGVVRGRLHLGILMSLAPYVDMPAVLARFRRQYPLVEFAVKSLKTGDVPAQVKSGYVDLSFNAVIKEDSWPGLTSIPFLEDDLVAICSKTHLLSERTEVGIDQICTETFVDLTPERALRKLVDQICSAHETRRKSVYQVTNVDTLLQFVGAGLGVALVPSGLATIVPYSDQLHVLRLTPTGIAIPRWKLIILTRSDEQRLHNGKSTVQLFLRTLAQVMKRSSKT